MNKEKIEEIDKSIHKLLEEWNTTDSIPRHYVVYWNNKYCKCSSDFCKCHVCMTHYLIKCRICGEAKMISEIKQIFFNPSNLKP
jgi:hypothetical protein